MRVMFDYKATTLKHIIETSDSYLLNTYLLILRETVCWPKTAIAARCEAGFIISCVKMKTNAENKYSVNCSSSRGFFSASSHSSTRCNSLSRLTSHSLFFSHKYSWAFGIVLWEICTLGETNYVYMHCSNITLYDIFIMYISECKTKN